MATIQLAADRAVAASRRVLDDITRHLRPRPFTVRFWDDTTWEPDPGTPAGFTLALAHPGAVRSMFWPPNDVSVGEAFVHGGFAVLGDLTAFLAYFRRLSETPPPLAARLALAPRLLRLPKDRPPRTGRGAAQLTGRRDSPDRARQAAEYHYDVSNEFFCLWLDPWLQYTSGVFADPAESQAAGQERKLDYICRKLRLKPGDRLLDVGCGWGGLVTFAAKNYGVDATGVTISRAQAAFANELIRKHGVADRCRIICDDYRAVPEDKPFDKVATVEVLEHFSAAAVPAYFQKVHRLLRPGGSLMVQAITTTGPVGVAKWRAFNRKYVFPDGELRPVSTIQREGEAAGFEVRDVEGLREHYVLTLRKWLDALEGCREAARKVVDEPTYRTFRLYLAGATVGYESGAYNVHEVLFVKPDGGRSGYPLTRGGWNA